MSALEDLRTYFMKVAYLKAPETDPDHIDATSINKRPTPEVMGWLYQIWLEKFANLNVDAILPVPEAANKFAQTFSDATGVRTILQTQKLKDGESSTPGAVIYATESFTHGKKIARSEILGLKPKMRIGILDDVIDDASTYSALMEALRASGLNIQVVLMTVIFSKHHNRGGEKVTASGVNFFSAIPVEISNGVLSLVA